MGRQSLTGALNSPSQKRLLAVAAAGGSTASVPRTSSPGTLGGGGGGGGGGESPMAPAVLTSPGSLPPFGETTPRLPLVSDSGDKLVPRPPANVMLRRASTLASMNVGQPLTRDSPTGSKDLKDRSQQREQQQQESALGGESSSTLKKERNALRSDKNALLLNKRRLEALLIKLLEQLFPAEEASELAGQQQLQLRQSGSGGELLPRASTTRAQILKALNESTGLEKQLQGGGGGGGGGVGSSLAASFEAEAQLQDLTAKMVEMKAEHEIAISRLEGQLSYRRTQAAATTAALQKQLGEAQEELSRVKQQLAGAEAQVRESTQQSCELRKQVHNLNSMLSDKTKQLSEARDMLGTDKSTMATVIEMLKDQLREAAADRAAKHRLITELEYGIVHRDALLTEVHDRMNQAAAQAAAAAGVSSSAAAARAAASMQQAPPLDSRSSWGVRTTAAAAAAAAVRGHTRGGPLPPPHVSGPGTGAVTARRATRGSLSDEETYSGEMFEPADHDG